ncbi:MAG: leucine-rich repeat domain-containing protein, partial [Planctomycetota bacterium]
NNIKSLDPITSLQRLQLLQIGDNPLTDLKPLVDVCRADAEGRKMFAPYLRLYPLKLAKGNPGIAAQIKSLQEIGVRVK